jgi:hypothetical protein
MESDPGDRGRWFGLNVLLPALLMLGAAAALLVRCHRRSVASPVGAAVPLVGEEA